MINSVVDPASPPPAGRVRTLADQLIGSASSLVTRFRAINAPLPANHSQQPGNPSDNRRRRLSALRWIGGGVTHR